MLKLFNQSGYWFNVILSHAYQFKWIKTINIVITNSFSLPVKEKKQKIIFLN